MEEFSINITDGCNDDINKIQTEKVTLNRVFYYYMMHNRAKNNDNCFSDFDIEEILNKFKNKILT